MAETALAERQKASAFTGWFTTRPLWYLFTVAVIINGLVLGVGPVPWFRLDHEAMDNPWAPIDGETVGSSPLAWIVADTIHVESYPAMVGLHLLWLIGSLAGGAYFIRHKTNDWTARLFIVAWFALPLAAIHLSWLGKPDPGTMLATVLMMFGGPVACVIGGLLVGFNHFEQGLIVTVAVFVVRWALRGDRDRDRRPGCAAVGGLVVGRALWYAYAAVAGVGGGERLSYIVDRGVKPYLDVWGAELPTLIFGVFGVVWAPVIVMWRTLDQRPRIISAALLTVTTLAGMATLDTTRVVGILAFPLVLLTVAWWAERDRTELLRVLPWFLLAAVFVPRPTLYVGQTYVSAWERFT